MNLDIFDRFPVLRTPRLVLREPVLADAAAVRALYRDDEVNRFQLQDAPATHDAARAIVARWRRRFAMKAEIRWAITAAEGGAFLGTGAFAYFIPGLDRGHLTYELARSAWGRGLATEAVRAMVAFGHGEAALNRIEAVVLPTHEASVRVLRKAGFAEEGVMRAYARHEGQYHDLRMFSILRGP